MKVDCIAKFGVEHLAWQCGHCNQNVDPYHPAIQRLLWLLDIIDIVDAGASIHINDMGLQDWHDIVDVRRLRSKKR